ncbi:fungal-specific transcription factor domain-containing protein [Talaromyces proteolyticus]|uniref:Fungal-specific transcription factor domain-containing protein n=1 Tax=Talaromyces proteolyticus TaxID=1131652 RepID=A0AAD4KTB0_9EURO|nr:fungal-specific transcription factor domain-containing protein [Talaromyces proteolyticus]KAH8696116.1 fungal-specific transcription factor domain-containing protein [Talaromyces proteolyticus]
MRSSIACSRCRRSKIKCVNAGIDTTCRACESTGRECVYPAPAIGGASSKRDLAATLDGDDRAVDWDNPKRSRPRKVVGPSGSAAKDAAKANADVLDSPILTPKVWETLSDRFQSHFAAFLPFIDPITFRKQVGQLAASLQDGQSAAENASQSPVPKPEISPLILLGVLALTARFHPSLVSYHSPAATKPNPSAASEFYAAALRHRLAGSDGLGFALPDLTRVQALLMLALHEWGMCRGKSAWVYVGIAIRLSQAMGLSYDLENEYAVTRPSALKLEADLSPDAVIAQETKRRTFWACFIMDRCLSSGKHRPRMLKVRELAIQLPSDNALEGERVRTSRLCDSPARRPSSIDGPGVQIPSLRQSFSYNTDEKLRNGSTDTKAWSPVATRNDSGDHEIDRWEVGAEEAVSSRVIRIIRIWGSIAKWACAGGRRNESYGPWQSESRFSQLRTNLAEFQDSLPKKIQYSQRNNDKYTMQITPFLPSYMVMHVVYFLSLIVLHRAYLPFLPLRCNEPVGPLDEPTFPREKYAVPEGFWRDSTRELFRAARQMLDLVMACQDKHVLETPLVGFAIYNAAFMGVYAAHFSHLDIDGYLSSKRSLSPPSAATITQPQVLTQRALNILRDMRPRLKLATGWFRTLNRLHSYYIKVKKDFKSHSRGIDGVDASNGSRLVREGGPGGGVEEFKLLEKIFLEFGDIDDRIPEAASPEEDDAAQAIPMSERGVALSDNGSNAVKSESGDSQIDGVAQQRRESWVPINSSSNTANLPPPPPDNGRRPSLPSLQRSLQPQSPYSLPSLQHHNSISSTTSPSYPSLTSPAAYSSAPPSQPLYAPNRLQPLNSWVTSHQQGPPPSYSQSLPPINANAHSFPMLPPPGSVTYGGGTPHPAPDVADYHNLWSTSLGGDDLVAFLDGGSYEHWRSLSDSEIGYPAGWLSAVWNDLP